jgi:LmbE family N-acetylglucosaminyl deacetylase
MLLHSSAIAGLCFLRFVPRFGGFFCGENMKIEMGKSAFVETLTNAHEILQTELRQIKAANKVDEKVITLPDGREIFIAVLDPEKAFSDLTAIVGESHPDDAILGEGINIISSEIGVGVTYVTMTDGSARDLEGFDTPKVLALRRRRESVEAAKEAGAAMVINFGYRDSELQNNKPDAVKELQAVLDIVNPQYMIAPNRSDSHKDHSAGSAIAKKASRKRDIPVYGTDTQTKKGRWGFRLRPTHYFEVSPEVKTRRDHEYEAHASQVNVPDRTDVNEVFALPEVRGAEKGWKYGGVLFKSRFGKDTVAQLLQQNDIAFSRRATPRVVFESMRRRLTK